MSFLQTNCFPQVIHGLDESSEAYFLAKLWRENPSQKIVRITPDLKSALTLKQNLEFFLGAEDKQSLLFFPPHEVLPYTGIVPGPDILCERLSTLHALLHNPSFILIVPAHALLRGVIPQSFLKKHTRVLYRGEKVLREEFLKELVDAGYQREVLVESWGDFAVRGFLVDVYPPNAPLPIRLEFDGDYLMDLRFFDPSTQKTEDEKISSFTCIPANEILLDKNIAKEANRSIKKFADELELGARARREVQEKFEARFYFAGIETFLPAFYEGFPHLFDYLPKETFLFLPDFKDLEECEATFRKEVLGLFATTKTLEKLIPPDRLLATWDFLKDRISKFSLLFVNPWMSLEGSTTHRFDIENSAHLKRVWNPEILEKWHSQGFKIQLVCHTDIAAERLQDILRGKNISLPISLGKLSCGFRWKEEGVVVLTEEEIFGHKTIKRTKPSRQDFTFTNFSQIEVGNYLVHEEHGICRYQGLKNMVIQNVSGDYLELEFLRGDKLYLPVYRMNLVGRYVSSEQKPFLDSLGGVRWKQVKQKASKEIEVIALELLKIHAERSLHEGESYPPPDALDEEFAAHFPYDETPDQARAIEDVFKDMQDPKPMDRLICGDVGYGKTEVAMRAAFKAVSAGKQVAFLVPTTILALQHFETFQARFSKLAISVEMLSRFRSSKEQKEVLKKCAEGKLDIVIGTHRLLVKDVLFKKLGLLIVDEEHRFGVKHKEKIKQMRPTIDVLTLSATPIPRTLHMSLLGLRDLSIIHTPPVDRISIRTFVAAFDDALVKHAVEQELARGGQVFFIHNRVATINSMYRRLKTLFPQASISVAHGQMKESELEKVMIDFLHQKIQILLTTAIVESGIDVPNANTMVVHRADTFGLAQLYQLRGRVGRSDSQAYCYLLIPDEEKITRDAKRRLSILTRHVDLGAGFQIASEDLELRGAGNLLGAKQSGFIETIGYEMYTKMLAETIQKMRGEKVQEEINPEIQLRVEAFIPETYVEDPHLRMALYKRLSHLVSEEEIASFQEELIDRFGPMPDVVSQLLRVVLIRQLAAKLKVKSFQYDGSHFILEWSQKHFPSLEALVFGIQKNPTLYQLRPPQHLWIRSPHLKNTALLSQAKEALKELLQWCEGSTTKAGDEVV